MLGVREPGLYGPTTLLDIESALSQRATDAGAELRCVQSNHEGEMVDAIQAARLDCDGILLNPAAYGHTSVALRDALLATGLPTIEIHLSNLARREDFRQRTYTAAVALGQISGFGAHSYTLALDALLHHLRADRTET
jgi:3-dehydroquinate dehydratase II